VSLDDDIVSLNRAVQRRGKLVLEPVPRTLLKCLVQKAWEMMNDNNAYIWGINVTQDCLQHLHATYVSRKLGLVIGLLYGIRNRHIASLHAQQDALEDYERSLYFWHHDHAMLRFRMLAITSKYQTNPGGLQASMENRKEQHMKASRKLTRMWSEYVSMRDDGPTELMFKPIGPDPLSIRF
jgi:hypothetical protein